MNDPMRIIDLVASYLISAVVVGIFYFFGLIDDPIIYNVILRATFALLSFMILHIVVAVSLTKNEQKNTFFQKHPPDTTGEVISKVCLIFMVLPSVLCVFDCVILKIIYYGL